MSKSGYAADIMPGIVNADEAQGQALPRAELNGRQHGRTRLDPVAMGQKPFKVVDTSEANKNLTARLKGELPPIAPKPTATTNTKAKTKPARRARNKVTTVEDEQALRRNDPMEPVNDADNFDPLGGEYAPGDPVLEAEEKALALSAHGAGIKAAQESLERRAPLGATNKVLTDRVYQPVQTLHSAYLDQRARATLTLTDGTFSMPCIDVKECPLGFTLLLPLDPSGSTFIPKPGTAVEIGYKDKRWKCFFPGVYCEIAELKVVMLMFIRAEE